MTDLTSLTLAEARDQLKSRAISSVDLTRAHLEAIERGKGLNAYVTVTGEKALAMAEASDARIASGAGGRLEGLPIGIKDLYATEGVTSLTFQENVAATTQTINGISMVGHSIYACVQGGTRSVGGGAKWDLASAAAAVGRSIRPIKRYPARCTV